MTLHRSLFMALMSIALIAAGSRLAQAGRVGGPASEAITVTPFQTFSVDVTLMSGRPAIISVQGNGACPLDVRVYDGDGHVFTALGRGDQKVVTINVYKQGVFQIQIYNRGPWSNTCIVSTN